MSINSSMKSYNYYLIGERNSYGELTINTAASGKIEMAINTASQGIKDNILYSSATYIGLTKENITDKYIIQFNEEKLKVLYVNPFGRLNQVFMEPLN